jgi:hypothetical protein
MASKINKRTRIKISVHVLAQFRNDDGSYINVFTFASEIGLKMTSRKNTGKHGDVFYFQVIDAKKWMLSRLKYEII